MCGVSLEIPLLSIQPHARRKLMLAKEVSKRLVGPPRASRAPQNENSSQKHFATSKLIEDKNRYQKLSPKN